jgi:hypothetical protein
MLDEEGVIALYSRNNFNLHWLFNAFCGYYHMDNRWRFFVKENILWKHLT